MKLSIIGLGNLGTAIAYIAAGNGHTVKCWEYDAAVVEEVNQQHRNQRYLADRELPHTISATTQLGEVFSDTELLFITLPARFIAPVLTVEASSLASDVAVVNMSKGIDAGSFDTAFGLVSKLFPDHSRVMLAGPSLANEFVNGVTTGLVAASSSTTAIDAVSLALSNERFFVQGSNDPVGVEFGGILKNIYALGLGLFSDAGLNFTGAYLTQALTEMKALGVALGANANTFDGLSGIGDLIATSLSDHSHNRSMGKRVAQGLSLAEIEKQMGVLPEGYHTLSRMLPLADELAVAMPLAKLLDAVIEGREPVANFLDSFTQLMRG